ncbi:hypothetical protein OIU84_012375 [Salix udensis]|uniref:Uncharacterized protein n=1 Tax=Salix udensis TaxID=889485 RepID=A0AAD6JFE9_9ROSI|nr:hypothetical protein OIU84_012375 [Salix udensis]
MDLEGWSVFFCMAYSIQTLNPLLFLLPLAFSNFLPFDRT